MNPISSRLKVSDIAPTTLRLQPDVRDQLVGEEPLPEPFTVPNLTSFGEDAAGALYAVSGSGTLYRLAS